MDQIQPMRKLADKNYKSPANRARKLKDFPETPSIMDPSPGMKTLSTKHKI
jgi:hypothetical protein